MDIKVRCGLQLVLILDFLGLNDKRVYKWHALQSENVFHHLKGSFRIRHEVSEIWILPAGLIDWSWSCRETSVYFN